MKHIKKILFLVAVLFNTFTIVFLTLLAFRPDVSIENQLILGTCVLFSIISLFFQVPKLKNKFVLLFIFPSMVLFYIWFYSSPNRLKLLDSKSFLYQGQVRDITRLSVDSNGNTTFFIDSINNEVPIDSVSLVGKGFLFDIGRWREKNKL